MKIQIMSPAADRVDFKVQPARRPETLAGKKVGVYGNQTGGDDVVGDRIIEHLNKRYPGIQTVRYGGPKAAKPGRPSLSRGNHIDDEEAKRIAQEVDVVVGATAH